MPPVLAKVLGRAVLAVERGATTLRETLPAIAGFAERVLARAIALVRGRPPDGVAPEDIDGFVERHGDRLRALTSTTIHRRAA